MATLIILVLLAVVACIAAGVALAVTAVAGILRARGQATATGDPRPPAATSYALQHLGL